MNHRQGSIAIGQVPSLIPALHIWNGHASPARSQNTQVGPDSIWPSHGNPPPPFFIVDRFSRRIYALPLVVLAGRMCLGGCGGKYTTCSVPAAPVVMSCPVQHSKMFWLLHVQTQLQSFTFLSKTSCAPCPMENVINRNDAKGESLALLVRVSTGGMTGMDSGGDDSYSVSSGQLGLAQVSVWAALPCCCCSDISGPGFPEPCD